MAMGIMPDIVNAIDAIERAVSFVFAEPSLRSIQHP